MGHTVVYKACAWQYRGGQPVSLWGRNSIVIRTRPGLHGNEVTREYCVSYLAVACILPFQKRLNAVLTRDIKIVLASLIRSSWENDWMDTTTTDSKWRPAESSKTKRICILTLHSQKTNLATVQKVPYCTESWYSWFWPCSIAPTNPKRKIRMDLNIFMVWQKRGDSTINASFQMKSSFPSCFSHTLARSMDDLGHAPTWRLCWILGLSHWNRRM